MYALTAGTLVFGLALTAILTVLSHTVYTRNEHHLLSLRVRDASALVSAALPAVQTPLASVAELADATDGSTAKFRSFASSYVGPRGEFASLSIWDQRNPGRGPLAYVGLPPQLPAHPADVQTFFAKVARSTTLRVVGLLQSSQPRLGYGYSTPGHGRFAAYAEAVLRPSRYAPVKKSSPFAGMRYALYLGRPTSGDLLATDVHSLPLRGGVTERIPFGSSSLIVTMATAGPLAGTLPQELPWIILGAGVLLSLLAATGVTRLTQRRLAAEGLAGELEEVARENRRLYSEQRGIAQTLQHALLPDELPQLSWIQAAGEYQAGERNTDIGGDWYDVVALSEDRVMLVVGDVSGRGLRAGTTMASLRFAIRAYATEEDSPQRIMNKLSRLLSLSRDRQLATVLCARIDREPRQVTMVSAGHLPPLLLDGRRARFLELPVGLPIGVDRAATYQEVTVPVADQATLVAFTDGLVERRGEPLDAGLDRLRNAALRSQLALPDLLSNLVADLTADAAKDDIAMVGLRWTR
ncbi:MAG TPA: PP2C family protein-serine/threonine phosphatase [Solirubrobacteraceae bacterium]|nr:PP2C family protein-serine/threonine phosphatase [Solirubrobacteraceae bacterium]